MFSIDKVGLLNIDGNKVNGKIFNTKQGITFLCTWENGFIRLQNSNNEIIIDYPDEVIFISATDISVDPYEICFLAKNINQKYGLVFSRSPLLDFRYSFVQTIENLNFKLRYYLLKTINQEQIDLIYNGIIYSYPTGDFEKATKMLIDDIHKGISINRK